MNGNKLALDTNIAIALLNGEQKLWQWLQQFDAVALPVPVIGELCFGAKNSKRTEKNLTAVQALIKRSQILDMTAKTAEVYGELKTQLKRQGNPIPENDLWIAARCIEDNILLASLDKHFELVPDLKLKSQF